MRLAAVCSIQMGYTARGRIEPAADGMLAIQLSDLSADAVPNPDRLTRASLIGISDRYLVREGDVLFRSRGERNTAHALNRSFVEPVVAILPLVILRPNPRLVTADYLAWVLNQAPAQKQLEATAHGTNIRMVPKASLDELDVDTPDLPTQHRITEIANLVSQEEALMGLLADKRRQLVSLTLSELAKRASPKEAPTRRTS